VPRSQIRVDRNVSDLKRHEAFVRAWPVSFRS